jgi:hypothetical protein
VPAARKSTRSSSRSSAAFKEPAALKRLSQSLDGAQKALVELRKHAGTDAGKATKSAHGRLQKAVAGAKTDTRKLTSELKRDFAKAQKTVAGAATTARKSTARRTTARAAAKRGNRKTS